MLAVSARSGAAMPCRAFTDNARLLAADGDGRCAECRLLTPSAPTISGVLSPPSAMATSTATTRPTRTGLDAVHRHADAPQYPCAHCVSALGAVLVARSRRPAHPALGEFDGRRRGASWTSVGDFVMGRSGRGSSAGCTTALRRRSARRWAKIGDHGGELTRGETGWSSSPARWAGPSRAGRLDRVPAGQREAAPPRPRPARWEVLDVLDGRRSPRRSPRGVAAVVGVRTTLGSARIRSPCGSAPRGRRRARRLRCAPRAARPAALSCRRWPPRAVLIRNASRLREGEAVASEASSRVSALETEMEAHDVRLPEERLHRDVPRAEPRPAAPGVRARTIAARSADAERAAGAPPRDCRSPRGRSGRASVPPAGRACPRGHWPARVSRSMAGMRRVTASIEGPACAPADGVGVDAGRVGHGHAPGPAGRRIDVVRAGAPDGDRARRRGQAASTPVGEAGVGADVDGDLRVADPPDQLRLPGPRRARCATVTVAQLSAGAARRRSLVRAAGKSSGDHDLESCVEEAPLTEGGGRAGGRAGRRRTRVTRRPGRRAGLLARQRRRAGRRSGRDRRARGPWTAGRRRSTRRRARPVAGECWKPWPPQPDGQGRSPRRPAPSR